MNILLIHQYFLEENDGGGSRFNEMTKQWSKNGHHVTVLAGMMHANGSEKRPEYKGKLFFNKQHEKVSVIRCHVSESYNKGFVGRLWGYFSFVFSSIWAGLFKAKGKYDVILVTSPPLFVGITAYIISLFKRLPFIFEVRDLWPESAIDTGVLTNKFLIKFSLWFEKFIYKKSRLINVLTPAFRETLKDKKKVPPEKIIFVPNAADFSLAEKISESDFDPENFRKELGWQDKFVITYVGAHGVANHLSQVIDTAKIIKDTQPNVLFVLIGDGMQKKELISRAKEENCSNILFLDSVQKSEVFKYILASDYGASILKKVDTFKTIYSNKTFDYMSCKKPVFLAIDGVSKELIESAECGVYVEPENPQDWAIKIAEIQKLDNIQLGLNGFLYAKKHFDREKLADKYIEDIERAIDE
ncbi:glycosyltransferase family 4 protein [Portibacter lacus]|uniref:Glycosyltransferase WbuB n=1 Tax=Portibacter lacus TaxID=1099794 RepID=A0AA37WH41_9BACT|nr:glycosyltransferase family 4 protein [Portibacter lacus]GLR18869.1 glycosyltransferase WbuB [Portibacter lacus]